jgi:hypothetical protein
MRFMLKNSIISGFIYTVVYLSLLYTLGFIAAIFILMSLLIIDPLSKKFPSWEIEDKPQGERE